MVDNRIFGGKDGYSSFWIVDVKKVNKFLGDGYLPIAKG